MLKINNGIMGFLIYYQCSYWYGSGSHMISKNRNVVPRLSERNTPSVAPSVISVKKLYRALLP